MPGGPKNLLVALAAISLLITGLHQPEPREPSRYPARLRTRHLANVVRLHPDVISGSRPAGPIAFRELKQLGVKTIISVDGPRPDRRRAKRLGLRYVHMPQGYDGIESLQIQRLAKGIHELPGPIYVHCHHGRHRAPAAAVAACIALGYMSPTEGARALRFAGASKKYSGLYDSVRRARQLDVETIELLETDFEESVAPPLMVEFMTKMEARVERLEHTRFGTNTGQLPEARHGTLLLTELLTELARTPAAQRRGDRFMERLRNSESSARRLYEILTSEPADMPTAKESLRRIRADCVACHVDHRN